MMSFYLSLVKAAHFVKKRIFLSRKRFSSETKSDVLKSAHLFTLPNETKLSHGSGRGASGSE
jgi:hypothetical protein